MYGLISQDYLMHYGVKGMKWGVRKQYQTTGRFKNSNNQNRRLKRNLKRGAIVAGAILGAAAGYYLYRTVGKQYFDSMILKGTTFQTMTHRPELVNQGKAFYASFSKLDNARYRAYFGQGGFKPDNKYKVTGKFINNTKVAGLKTSNKTFNDLLKTDKQFKDSVEKLGFKDHIDLNKRGLRDTLYVDLGKGTRQDYDYVRNKFINTLKDKGYSGLLDYQDRSGKYFKANSATILFGNNYGNVKYSQITDSEIFKAKKIIDIYDKLRLVGRNHI
jgi:hypothetical protein